MKKTVILVLVIIMFAFILGTASSVFAQYTIPGFTPQIDTSMFDRLFKARQTALLADSGPYQTKLFPSEADYAAFFNMSPGSIYQLNLTMPFFWEDETLIWTSSNPAIVTVNPAPPYNHSVWFNALSPGTTEITYATADGSFSKTFTIIVRP